MNKTNSSNKKQLPMKMTLGLAGIMIILILINLFYVPETSQNIAYIVITGGTIVTYFYLLKKLNSTD